MLYEGNETAQKLLAELEQVQDTKSCAAAKAEMVAKLLTVKASLSEARDKILVLQQQNRMEAEARGLLKAQLERVVVETSALGINLQEAKKAYSIRAS